MAIDDTKPKTKTKRPCELCLKADADHPDRIFFMGSNGEKAHVRVCEACFAQLESFKDPRMEVAWLTYTKYIFVNDATGNKTHQALLTASRCYKCDAYYRTSRQLFLSDRMEKAAICRKCYSEIEDRTAECHNCGMKYLSYADDLCKRVPKAKRAEVRYCDTCTIQTCFPMKFEAHAFKGIYPPSGATIGIEMECEPNIESQINIAEWKQGRGYCCTADVDHSLRGKFPVEFKSPILHESNYEEWLEEFGKRVTARVYNRCGLHIHIGSKGLSWCDVQNIAHYCAMHEAEFYSIVAKSRMPGMHDATSGLPMTLPREYMEYLPRPSKSMFLKLLYGTENPGTSLKESKRANDQHGPHYDGVIHRYQWLNLHSHFHRETLEIRLHQGTTNPEKVRNWIAAWLSLIPQIADQHNAERSIFELLPEDLKCYYRNRSLALHGTTRVLLPRKARHPLIESLLVPDGDGPTPRRRVVVRPLDAEVPVGVWRNVPPPRDLIPREDLVTARNARTRTAAEMVADARPTRNPRAIVTLDETGFRPDIPTLIAHAANAF